MCLLVTFIEADMEKEIYIRLIDFINENYVICNFESSNALAEEFMDIEENGFPLMTAAEKEIVRFVAKEYSVDIQDIFKESRGSMYVSEARQLIAFLFLDKLKHSIMRTARLLKRTHGAIVHAREVISNRIRLHQLLVNIPL